MRTRTVVLSVIGAFAVAGITAGVMAVLGGSDDDAVAPYVITNGAAPNAAAGRSTSLLPDDQPGVQAVQGLERLTGQLVAGKDHDDWYVSGVEVDFGPEGWIATAEAGADFDGDGTAETVLNELRGLAGSEVTLGVRFESGDDRDDADVYAIGSVAYRDVNGGPAPWQVAQDGAEATREAVGAAAAAAVGAGAQVLEIEREYDDGWNGWEVEVHDAAGARYKVYLDLSGVVADVRQKDND